VQLLLRELHFYPLSTAIKSLTYVEGETEGREILCLTFCNVPYHSTHKATGARQMFL